jgi:tRNA A22 N-methylase
LLSASNEQKSPPLLLENGKFYEIVVTLKEYRGQDYVTVAVELPSGEFLAPIPSQKLFIGELNYIKTYVLFLEKQCGVCPKQVFV